jgi:CRP/FNR family cyclic AMP-dependent transcriptional regulator
MAKPHESLDKIGLFRSLDSKEIAGLYHRCSWRHAQAKEWLFEQDDLGTDIYFLTSDAVQVLNQNRSSPGSAGEAAKV